ncbi:hypothetical protein AAG570_006444 [Ranatra chinensis]|uniref:Dystrophin n=1 Tax=Ranatra chinensis TaxID=642074 RepID=A0ABD0YU02_9HEMI
MEKECEKDEEYGIQGQLCEIEHKVVALEQQLKQHDVELEKDKATWSKYEESVKVMKPWLEQAEVVMSMGTIKPTLLSDAEEQLQQAMVFREESENKKPEVDKLQTLITELAIETGARDTVDALHSRWVAVESAARQRANRLDKLVAAWREMESTTKQIETWIDRPRFAEILNDNASKHETLDKQLAELKVMIYYIYGRSLSF